VNKLPPDHKKKNFDEEEDDSDFRDKNNAKMTPHTSASIELGVEANIFCREWHSNGSIAGNARPVTGGRCCSKRPTTTTVALIANVVDDLEQ
jgi:hypothetical protein